VSKVLVTGASGHIGANLVRALLRGEQPGVGGVRVLLQPGVSDEGVRGLDVERFEGDLRDRDATKRAVDGCDAVYHVAAKVSTLAGGEQEIFDTNVIGTRNVLAAAKAARVRRVVVSGSLSAVGRAAAANGTVRNDPDRPSDETMPFNPFAHDMPYAWTKALVELGCWEAFANGLDVVVATSCAVLGPNDFVPSRMGRVLLDFANGRLRAYIPGGFEFVCARDIVRGHILAMEKGRGGQKYIFASGYMSVDDLMDVYEEVTGQPRPRRLPAGLMMGIAQVTSPLFARFFPRTPQRFTPAAVRLLTMQRKADCTKAREELGYRPTPIRDAVRDAHAHFVERGLIRERRGAVLSAGTA
jgi:nucleoside-diphosphate-sugar epimerase